MARQYIFGYNLGTNGFTPTKISLDEIGNVKPDGKPKHELYGQVSITEEDFEHKSLDELQLLYPLDTSKISEDG